MLPSIDPADVGLSGLMWLLLSYGYILFYASNLISEGSDLLLLVPSMAGLVGSVVLPLLGAVPDGAIMLFSGLGPDVERVQETLSVGVGALAGSTIMLLTVPWALGVVSGRVELSGPEMEPNYRRRPKLSEEGLGGAALRTTGVAVTSEIQLGAKMMAATTLPYFLIQVPAWRLAGGTRGEVSAGETRWALGGLVVCVALFVGYLWLQVKMSNEGADKLRRMALIKDSLKKGALSLSGALANQLHHLERRRSDPQDQERLFLRADSDASLFPADDVAAYLAEILKDSFLSYDQDASGTLEKKEFSLFLTDFHETITPDKLHDIFTRFDRNHDNTIDFHEFIGACYTIIKQAHAPPSDKLPRSTIARNIFNSSAIDDDDDEHEDIPEELSSLSPDAQQRAIQNRAFSMLFFGTALVLLFSDPMVDVLQEISTRANLPPFYVSFLLAPLASNASEVIASQYYSAKKTRKSITVALTALEGAATMNNTFCLAIFMGLIYARDLAWQYSAETLAIVLVQWIMAALAQKNKMTVGTGFIVLALFPLSILFVALLEHFGLD